MFRDDEGVFLIRWVVFSEEGVIISDKVIFSDEEDMFSDEGIFLVTRRVVFSDERYLRAWYFYRMW